MRRLRTTLGAIGILTGAVGALRDDRRLGWVAITLVGAAIVLRVIDTARRREQRTGDG